MVPAGQLHREIDERLEHGQNLIDRPAGNEDALGAGRQDYYT
jgi:hypothetical protein